MTKTFESTLGELEAVVRQLEAGDLPLEKSLKLFEDGVRLARECREKLADAERRIEILVKDGDGTLTLSEFEPDAAPREAGTSSAKRIVFGDGD